jgi:hypothetical protein
VLEIIFGQLIAEMMSAVAAAVRFFLLLLICLFD